MVQLISTYILSNSYYIKLYSMGPKKYAVLYSPSDEVLNTGEPSFSASEDALINEQIIGYWPSTYSSISIKEIQSSSNSTPISNIYLKKYSIEGKVIDEISFSPLEGINISISTKGNNNKEISTKSDKKGYYKLDIILETNSDTQLSNETPSIYFSDSTLKYSDNSIIPFTQDNQLLKNPQPVKLKTKSTDLDEKKVQYKQLDSKLLKQATNTLSKSPEEALVNFIKSQIKVLLNSLLPAILTILAAFGIDKLNGLLNGNKGICPKQSKIDELIKLRNQIVEQLNSISKSIDILIQAVGIAQGLIAVLKVIFNIILAIPIPVAVPPGIVLPQSIIQKGADVVQTLKKLADQFLNISTTVLMALLIFKSIIAILLNLLNVLDSLLLSCYPQASLLSLDSNLLLIQQEINDANNTNEQVLTRRLNGFTLEIQILNTNAVGNLKRKQAVAKNSQGVILLTGEPSFSASEQILLDELYFYIQSNNLKAY